MAMLTSGVISPMVLPIESLEDIQEQHECLLRLNKLRNLRNSLVESELVAEVGAGADSNAVTTSTSTSNTAQDIDVHVLTPEKVLSTIFTGRLVNVPSLYLVKEKCHNSVVILTVLLTYGVAFPPLACICALNIIVTTLSTQLFILHHYQQFRLRMESPNRRLVHSARECYTVWSDIVANEIKDSHSILFENRTFLYLISVLTMLLFIYDATTSNGENEWVYSTMICIVIGVYLSRVCVIVMRRVNPPVTCDDNYINVQYNSTRSGSGETVRVNVNTIDNPILRQSESGVELPAK